MIIKDGAGSGSEARVNASNKLDIHGVTQSEALYSIESGDGYNINTGLITAIASDSSLLYVKNNENKDLVIDTIFVAGFNGITHSDDPYLTIRRNPTGGDLISDATAVSSNVNRNFGSSNTLSVTAYKGKNGGTITGGDVLGILALQQGARDAFPINLIISKGQSISLQLTANVSSGSASYYAAMTCYLKNSNFK